MVNELNVSRVVVEVYIVNIYIVHIVFITWVFNEFCLIRFRLNSVCTLCFYTFM